ncbi:hypothetical protein FG386_000381 [Cryptosporidium ryanae]|uniref:uncharacterized protein n=1 Tax=Cryptosporidium ryanae TaxID=515981 RepID=UPI00351A3CED|nr:hypothetical protein FG386_000381 [Cryptosporidium ryanae]
MEVTRVQLGLNDSNREKCGSIFSTTSGPETYNDKFLENWIKSSSRVKKFAKSISIAINRALGGGLLPNIEDLYNQNNTPENGYLRYIFASLSPILENEVFRSSFNGLSVDLRMGLVDLFLDFVVDETILPEISFLWKSFGLPDGDMLDFMLTSNETISTEGFSKKVFGGHFSIQGEKQSEGFTSVGFDVEEKILEEGECEENCADESIKDKGIPNNRSDFVNYKDVGNAYGYCFNVGISGDNVLSFHYNFLFGLNRFILSYILGVYGVSYIIGIDGEYKRDVFVRWCITQRSVCTYECDYQGQNEDECGGNTNCGHEKLTLDYFLDSISRSCFDKDDSRRLGMAIDKYKERVYSLFSNDLPAGFEKALEMYLNEFLTFISDKMLGLILTGSIRESDFTQNGCICLKRELFKLLGRSDFGQEKEERLESYISRLECFQNMYESKFLRLLGLDDGSYDSLNFEVLVLILKLVVGRKGLCSLEEEGINIDSEFASLSPRSFTRGVGELENVLRSISERPIASEGSKLTKKTFNGNGCSDDGDDEGNRLDRMEDGESEGIYFRHNKENSSNNKDDVLSLSVNELFKRNLLILGEVIKLLFGLKIDASIYNCINKSVELSPIDFVGNLNILTQVVGLGETWKVLAVSALKSHAAKVVLLLEKQEFRESNLRIYSSYIHNYIGPLAEVLLEGGIHLSREKIGGDEWSQRNYRLKRVYEELYMEYALNLRKRLIDLILEFPDNKKDNVDLFAMINSFPSSDILKVHWYSGISRGIQNYVLKELLEPHIDTYDILGFYVKGIFFLLKLDVPKEWINRALSKLVAALRQRNDTTQCIIGWMPFLIENSSMEETEADLVVPITCSDEGVYPQFSIIEPNYRNEGRYVFTRLKDASVSRRSRHSMKDWSYIYGDGDRYGDDDHSETNGFNGMDSDMWIGDINDIRIENCINKPPIKLVLEWISRIYGNNLTLLHDFINNFAQRVLGNSLEIGFDITEKKIKNSSLIDEKCWTLDENGLKRDESVYELIKLTVGTHNGENIRGGVFGTPGEGGGGSVAASNKKKDEEQLFSHCSVIIQDIAGSVQDNREYSSRGKSHSMLDNVCQVVTGVTLSRSYWSGALNLDIREDSFPLASVLENEIDRFRKFFELEHPGRTFSCYPCYGNVEVDLTALDMSVKSGIKMNFLQVSIYEYLSDAADKRSSFRSSKGINLKEPTETVSLSISNSASNSLLNWFSLSPKSSEKQALNGNSASGERSNGGVLSDHTVCLEELVKHFGLDEETIRWNLESMMSRGLIEVKIKENKEQFGIPGTFDMAGKQRREGDCNGGSEFDQGVSQVKGNVGFGINDMTVMLDFSTLVKGAGSESTTGKEGAACMHKDAEQFSDANHDDVMAYDRLLSDVGDASGQEDGSCKEQGDVCCSELEEEDFNLNFPTGMLTSTLNIGKAKEGEGNVDGVYHRNGGEMFGVVAGGVGAERGVGSGTESGKVNAILPPFINTSETYLEKYCYFSTPVVLERPKESEKTALSKEGSQKKSDSGKYDIVRECELLIRGMLQLNGPMAPAVLFGRVRTAMVTQGEEKSTELAGEAGTPNKGTDDEKKTLTWSHHVKAINNMVDRGEVCNKGGRLFLEN